MLQDLPTDGFTPVVFIGLLVFLQVYGVFKQRSIHRDLEDRLLRPNRLKRPVPGFGTQILTWQIILVIFLAYSYLRGGWTEHSVGLRTDLWPPLAFLAGFCTYFVFLQIVTVALRAAGVEGKIMDINVHNISRLWPRQPSQRVPTIVAICLLNPITEELLFRGILVHQTAILSEHLVLAILLGLIANICNHLYQGLWPLTIHIPLFFVVTIILFSPLGLVGAIGFHFAGDLWPIATFRQRLHAYWIRVRNRRTQVVRKPLPELGL